MTWDLQLRDAPLCSRAAFNQAPQGQSRRVSCPLFGARFLRF